MDEHAYTSIETGLVKRKILRTNANRTTDEIGEMTVPESFRDMLVFTPISIEVKLLPWSFDFPDTDSALPAPNLNTIIKDIDRIILGEPQPCFIIDAVI